MPTMTVMSTTMRRLRREGIEIRRRMTTALAPTGLIAKNKKPPPPPPYARHATPAATEPGWNARPPPPSAAISLSGHAHAAAPPVSDPAEVVIKSKRIGKGAQVRVRTRVGTAACTGQPIVLWLRAVVAAADEDGYLHVTYSYTSDKLPRVARVAPSDVRMHDDVAHADDASGGATASGGCFSAADISDERSARPTQESKAAPRPTVAGKKLLAMKKLKKEMKSRSKAMLS